MAIVRYPDFWSGMNPFRELERMRREMDRLFSEAMDRGTYLPSSGVFPALNVSQDGDRFYVQAELPGINPSDIEISVEGNTLTLRGERKPEVVEGVSYHRRERPTGRFHRALTLPQEIDADKVEAIFKNGVLTLVLPKAEHAKPKKIAVKAS